MSHVTDGELHLVLDGALELLSADRAREVREHLEVCGDCGRRLEEERRIRDRSQELLRSTDPGAEPPPPFEEIRARAGRSAGGASSSGSSEMRGTPWIQGLAWAATVVLALGIGWYAGGRPPGAGVGAGPAPDRESAETQELGADRLSREGGAETSDADRLSRAAEAPAAGAPEREAPDPGRMEGAGARLSTAAAPQETPEPADARATDAVPAPATVRTAATPVNPDAASALAREGSLAIPGLPVLAVEWERPEGAEGGAALRLLQALPGGDTLVLRYAAAGDRFDDGAAAEEKAAPAAPAEPAARDQVRRETEGLSQDRVRARAGAHAPADAPEARNRAAAPAEAEAGGRTVEERAGAPGVGAAEAQGGVLRLRRGPWLLEARASLSGDSLRALLERLPPPE